MNYDFCDAIAHLEILELSYDGYIRCVEPHAYGRGEAGHDVLRCWQVSGGSDSNDSDGWKLLRVDEIRSLHRLPQRFSGPRPGYKRGDLDIAQIYCRL
jgi:hypothetical protein